MESNQPYRIISDDCNSSTNTFISSIKLPCVLYEKLLQTSSLPEIEFSSNDYSQLAVYLNDDEYTFKCVASSSTATDSTTETFICDNSDNNLYYTGKVVSKYLQQQAFDEVAKETRIKTLKLQEDREKSKAKAVSISSVIKEVSPSALTSLKITVPHVSTKPSRPISSDASAVTTSKKQKTANDNRFVVLRRLCKSVSSIQVRHSFPGIGISAIYSYDSIVSSVDKCNSNNFIDLYIECETDIGASLLLERNKESIQLGNWSYESIIETPDRFEAIWAKGTCMNLDKLDGISLMQSMNQFPYDILSCVYHQTRDIVLMKWKHKLNMLSYNDIEGYSIRGRSSSVNTGELLSKRGVLLKKVLSERNYFDRLSISSHHDGVLAYSDKVMLCSISQDASDSDDRTECRNTLILLNQFWTKLCIQGSHISLLDLCYRVRSMFEIFYYTYYY